MGAFSVDGLEGGQIGPAFIHGHDLRRAVAIDGLLEVAPRGSLVAMRPQQEIERISGLVHCAIQVLPLAAYLDVGFIHPPALIHRTFVLARLPRVTRTETERAITSHFSTMN